MSLNLSTSQLPRTKAAEITADLLEIILPPFAMRITIRSDVDLWLQLGVGEDGGTVDSAEAVPLDANFAWDFKLQGGDEPVGAAPSIFVATMTGTGTLYVMAEP